MKQVAFITFIVVWWCMHVHKHNVDGCSFNMFYQYHRNRLSKQQDTEEFSFTNCTSGTIIYLFIQLANVTFARDNCSSSDQNCGDSKKVTR